MPTIGDVGSFLAEENGLAVVSTTQRDGRVLSSVVNCGVMSNPSTKADSVAFVAIGSSARLNHIRRGSEVTVAVRRGWNWVSATGKADLVGPDEPNDGHDPEALRLLLREVFQSAGGTHDDWEEYDRVMAKDGRVAVFVDPARVLGNMPQS